MNSSDVDRDLEANIKLSFKKDSKKNSITSSKTSKTATPTNPMLGMGKHILAELWHCKCDDSLLTQTEPLLGLLVDAVQQVGLTLVGQVAHQFTEQQYTKPKSIPQHSNQDSTDPNIDTNPINNFKSIETQPSGGVTLSLLLAESHVCLHTWGEYNTVTLDVYVCNVSNDNSTKADALLQACVAIFKPQTHHINVVCRHHQMTDET